MTYYRIINNRITEASNKPFVDGKNYLEMEDKNFNIVEGYDGSWYFAEYTKTEEYKQLKKEFEDNSMLKQLRRQRDEECFKVVDRSKFWYDTLTKEQYQELQEWYNAWLKVTETKIIPTKPEWLN